MTYLWYRYIDVGGLTRVAEANSLTILAPHQASDRLGGRQKHFWCVGQFRKSV